MPLRTNGRSVMAFEPPLELVVTVIPLCVTCVCVCVVCVCTQVTELRLTHSAAVSQGRLAVQRAETAEQRVRELLSEQQHERNTLQVNTLTSQ